MLSFMPTIRTLNSPRRTRALALFCAALLVGASAACKSDYPASGQQRARGEGRGGEARQVKTAKVEEMPVGASVAVTGTLAAQDEATLSVKVPGRVSAVGVDLGSVVRKGQV